MAASSGDGMLQPDYGGFNPRFLGVSMFYDSPRNYNAVYAYLTGDEPADSPADLHSIVLRSVVDHEVRHYIDFLVSPYSTAVFRLRLMALINGAQALSLAKEIPGDVLPVPLTQWALDDEGRRAATCAEWGELLGEEATPIGVPHRTLQELQTDLPPANISVADLPADRRFRLHLEAAIRAYLRIDQLTQGFAATVDNPYGRPAYIHEASALTIQAAAIHAGQGSVQAATFLSFLLDSELPQAQVWQRHMRVAMLLERLWGGGTDDALIAIRRIPSITVWTMLGDYGDNPRRACPATRFAMLIEGLLDGDTNRQWSGDIDDPESLIRMWDFWDEQLEVTSWRTALANHVESCRRAVDTYRTMLEQWQGSSSVLDLASDAIDVTLRDCEIAVTAFLDDPRILAVPETYISSPPGSLPMPDVRIELRGFAVDYDPSTPGRAVVRRSPHGDAYAAAMAFPADLHDESRLEELDRKLELENLIEWCDLAFSRLSVPSHTVGSARRGLQELTDKRVLQLIPSGA